MTDFGKDIMIVNNEIVWNEDEIVMVGGERNVIQQAYLRCQADLGESLTFPEYGSTLRGYQGKSFTSESKIAAESEATQRLLMVGDGWIEEVLRCDVSLIEVNEKKKMLVQAKVKIRGVETPQDMDWSF
ncbi:DUF2634 domain-containing protein [Brevibacillus laterosporus]|uniref:DUF2634 domain-containing protein n=1 Tax=Brevibacillus laterosporus TaxID=1465 RepID=UPI00215CF468|nr:DUF2634 domain-containing protein [Brevibacillus laterosporus]MCR8939743.1 DUF2634 domain-containing protein [Brevibacillus laterosporus]MCZ0842383.1 DUF2634 domain-containing protein [Brevibacillus laterosporus]MCZ0846380.1 DUF2634 domain-containing protein [Brevibacillus laterosporus]